MNSLVSDKRISPSCFRVLCFLAAKSDRERKVTIGVRAIAAACGSDKDTICDALDEASAAGLITRTYTGGRPATYLLDEAVGKIPTSENFRQDEEEDDGGDWTTGGEGSSAKLAELMVSRLTASESDSFRHATARLIKWLRHGTIETPAPASSYSQREAKSVFIRVALVEHVLGLRSEESVIDFAKAAGVHRSVVYRGLESIDALLGTQGEKSRLPSAGQSRSTN